MADSTENLPEEKSQDLEAPEPEKSEGTKENVALHLENSELENTALPGPNLMPLSEEGPITSPNEEPPLSTLEEAVQVSPIPPPFSGDNVPATRRSALPFQISSQVLTGDSLPVISPAPVIRTPLPFLMARREEAPEIQEDKIISGENTQIPAENIHSAAESLHFSAQKESAEIPPETAQILPNNGQFSSHIGAVLVESNSENAENYGAIPRIENPLLDQIPIDSLISEPVQMGGYSGTGWGEVHQSTWENHDPNLVVPSWPIMQSYPQEMAYDDEDDDEEDDEDDDSDEDLQDSVVALQPGGVPHVGDYGNMGTVEETGELGGIKPRYSSRRRRDPDFFDKNGKKIYRCRKCGAPKKGHNCTVEDGEENPENEDISGVQDPNSEGFRGKTGGRFGGKEEKDLSTPSKGAQRLSRRFRGNDVEFEGFKVREAPQNAKVLLATGVLEGITVSYRDRTNKVGKISKFCSTFVFFSENFKPWVFLT